MGDARFQPFFDRVKGAQDRVAVLRSMSGSDIVQALAAASREGDPYFANMLATEMLNRLRRKRALLDSAAEGLLAVDRAGSVIFANKPAALLLGWDPGEVRGADIHQFVADWDDAIAQVEEDKPVAGDRLFVTQDGRTLRLACSMAAIHAGQGLEGHVMMVTDSTVARLQSAMLESEKAAFKSLAGSREPFESLTQVIDASVSATTGDCAALVAPSNSAWRVVATSRESPWSQPGPVTFSPRATDAFSKVIKSRDEVEVLDSSLFGNVGAGFSQVLLAPCMRSETRALGVLVLMRTASLLNVPAERDYADFVARLCGSVWEKAILQRERNRFSTLVDLIPDLVAVAEWNGRFTLLNPAWTKQLGWTIAELQSRPYMEFIHPSDRRASYETALGPPALIEGFRSRFLHKDGSFKWFEWTAINHEGRAFSIGRDVTTLVAREEEAQAEARRWASVARLGLTALRGGSLDALLRDTVQELADVLGVDLVKVLEYREDHGDFLLRAGVGWRPGLEGHATVPGDIGSQAGYTFNQDAPVVVQDLSHEERFHGPSLLFDHEVVSGLSVIIHGPSRPWGVLGIHTRAHRKFSQVEVDHVQAVANIIGVVIERDALRRRVAEQAPPERAPG